MSNELDLDPIYFASARTWGDRLKSWLAKTGEMSFNDANRVTISRCLQDEKTGLRMVINIPADALIGFLSTGEYLNAYNEPIIGKRPRYPSETRIQVDGLLQFDDPSRYYFGAAAVGGTGIRFYGEYCMVLRRERIVDETRVFDRNSYDLLRPPFLALDDSAKADLVKKLRGKWSPDLVHILVLKLLPALRDTQWLVTLGTISDAILHDEEFTEVHLEGGFDPSDVEEIRQAPEEETIENPIAARYRQGLPPTAAELLWTARRAFVTGFLARKKIDNRIVVSSGRGNRWK